MGSGRIVQVIGAVIDVEFPRDDVPNVYDALVVAEGDLTLEVQQQLGDGIVRTIAMGSSEGVSRGLAVENTKAPISVPVGEETLGRIMDVLGNPIDEKGPIGEQDRMPIHRDPPSYAEQAGGRDLLEPSRLRPDLPTGGGGLCRRLRRLRQLRWRGHHHQAGRGEWRDEVFRNRRVHAIGHGDGAGRQRFLCVLRRFAHDNRLE